MWRAHCSLGHSIQTRQPTQSKSSTHVPQTTYPCIRWHVQTHWGGAWQTHNLTATAASNAQADTPRCKQGNDGDNNEEEERTRCKHKLTMLPQNMQANTGSLLDRSAMYDKTIVPVHMPGVGHDHNTNIHSSSSRLSGYCMCDTMIFQATSEEASLFAIWLRGQSHKLPIHTTAGMSNGIGWGMANTQPNRNCCKQCTSRHPEKQTSDNCDEHENFHRGSENQSSGRDEFCSQQLPYHIAWEALQTNTSQSNKFFIGFWGNE